jgi:hypothetical protein
MFSGRKKTRNTFLWELYIKKIAQKNHEICFFSVAPWWISRHHGCFNPKSSYDFADLGHDWFGIYHDIHDIPLDTRPGKR